MSNCDAARAHYYVQMLAIKRNHCLHARKERRLNGIDGSTAETVKVLAKCMCQKRRNAAAADCRCQSLRLRVPGSLRSIRM